MESASAAFPPCPPQADAYEAKHVHAVYSAIASHFSATRYAPWPAVDKFLAGLPPHSLVADLGCGNGKYLLVASAASNNLHLLGVDRCAELAHIAAAHPPGFQAAVGNVLHLPLRDSSFDAAISIAVVHHLVTPTRRVDAWREAIRVLRPGGRLLAYVWALERPSTPEPRRGNHGRKMLSRRFEAQDVFVPWHLRRRKAGAQSDRILGDPEETHRRFYHVYRAGELVEELAQVSEALVLDVYYDHQNWCAVVQRR